MPRLFRRTLVRLLNPTSSPCKTIPSSFYSRIFRNVATVKSYVEKSRGILIEGALAILVVGLLPAAIHPASSATPTTTGLIVPLYSYPTNPTWSALIEAKLSYPNVPIIAIVNPDSGPGKSPNPDYVLGVASLQKAGIVVVGYVPTGYGRVKTKTM